MVIEIDNLEIYLIMFEVIITVEQEFINDLIVLCFMERMCFLITHYEIIMVIGLLVLIIVCDGSEVMLIDEL
jgi:hypothetical protein